MASNPRTKIDNRHELYIATSGGKKSSALFWNPAIPGRGARVLLWDPSRDHARSHAGSPTVYADTPAAFQELLSEALRSGLGFRIGYSGPRTPELFEEWFCPLVWRVIDGRADTFLVVEEITRACRTEGRSGYWFSMLIEEGRKFGLVIHATTQRAQGCPKDLYEAAAVWWIGCLSGRGLEYMIRERVVDEDALRALRPGQFLRYVQNPDVPTERVEARWKGF